MAGSSYMASGVKARSGGKFSVDLTEDDEPEATQAGQGSPKNLNTSNLGSRTAASRLNPDASVDLLQLEARLIAQARMAAQAETSRFAAQFESQFAALAKDNERQATEIQELKMKLMIVRAKVDGQGDAFYLFPRLPLELREMIWKEALPPRRIVEVGGTCRRFYVQLSGFFDSESYPIGFPRFFDTCPKPESLLYTCHESRKVTERAYKSCFTYRPERCYKFFTTNTCLPSDQVPAEAITWMGVRYRPQLDTIFLRDPKITYVYDWPLRKAITSSCLNGFKIDNIISLALDVQILRDSSTWREFFSISYGNQPRLANLERLIIVCSCEKVFWKDGFEFQDELYFTSKSLKAAVASDLEANSDIFAPSVEIMTEDELMAMS